MTRTFIMTSEFDISWAKLGLDDKDLKKLQTELLLHPDSGDMIRGTHGCRKIRIAFENRGKSGSARVVYVDFLKFEKIYLLTAYSKNEKENLSKKESNDIKELVKSLESIERKNYERRMEYEYL